MKKLTIFFGPVGALFRMYEIHETGFSNFSWVKSNTLTKSNFKIIDFTYDFFGTRTNSESQLIFILILTTEKTIISMLFVQGLSLCLLLAITHMTAISATIPHPLPTGYYPEDRFLGFRYVLTGSGISKYDPMDLMGAIVERADELFCFGWVQQTKSTKILGQDAYAGEARCWIEEGEIFQTFLRDELKELLHEFDDYDIVFKEYTDTKILLHFSHFKVLDSRRNTCFRDEPHQCDEDLLDIPLW